LMHAAIEMEGYQVEVAMNVDDALESARVFRPHILVTDWNLKESRDGIHLANAAMEADPNTAVLFITALPEELREKISAPEMENKMLSCDKILSKPVDLEGFLKAIDEIARGIEL
jgi:DNA-binding response OmpR family regulator